MKIHHITVDLVSAASQRYTVRARVGIAGGRFVEALHKEKSLEAAEEGAIERAKQRLRKEFASESVGAIDPKSPVVEFAKGAVEGAIEAALQEATQARTPPKGTIEETSDGRLVLAPKEKEQGTAQEHFRLAQSVKERAAEADIDSKALGLILAPKDLADHSIEALQALILTIEKGPDPRDLEIAKGTTDILEGAKSLEILAQLWRSTRGKRDVMGFWPKHLVMVRKDALKAALSTVESPPLPTQPAPTKQAPKGLDLCKSCGAEIRWVTTVGDQKMPLNPHSLCVWTDPTQSNGKPSEKRFNNENGRYKLVDTWRAPLGVVGALHSYQAHWATCPMLPNTRRARRHHEH